MKDKDKFIIGVMVAFSGLLVGLMVGVVPYQIRLLLTVVMAVSIWGKISLYNSPAQRFFMNVLYFVVAGLSVIVIGTHRNIKGETNNLTPIQERFVSQSTMTAHSMNSTYSVLSVGKELAPRLHEVKVYTGGGKNQRLVIFSALYFGEVKGGEEVDLIRIEQSNFEPYETAGGRPMWFFLAQPRTLRVDLKNDPYPGMQREEVEK